MSALSSHPALQRMPRLTTSQLLRARLGLPCQAAPPPPHKPLWPWDTMAFPNVFPSGKVCQPRPTVWPQGPVIIIMMPPSPLVALERTPKTFLLCHWSKTPNNNSKKTSYFRNKTIAVFVMVLKWFGGGRNKLENT